VKPDTAKIKAVNNFRVPENPTEVKSFLDNIVSIVSTVGYVLKYLLYNSLMNFGCRVNTEHQTFVPIQAFMTHECGDKS
jgi:hypothetical protein